MPYIAYSSYSDVKTIGKTLVGEKVVRLNHKKREEFTMTSLLELKFMDLKKIKLNFIQNH